MFIDFVHYKFETQALLFNDLVFKKIIACPSHYHFPFHRDEIYIAPSGVQKERIQPQDIFVIDLNEKVLSCPPAEKKLKLSECTPLFMNAYNMRSMSIIHL